MKWEYKILGLVNFNEWTLNNFGAEGWELLPDFSEGLVFRRFKKEEGLQDSTKES